MNWSERVTDRRLVPARQPDPRHRDHEPMSDPDPDSESESDPEPPFDREALRTTLDGEPLSVAAECDYCDRTLAPGVPALADVVRAVPDGPHPAAADGWRPAAARCWACEPDAVSPATRGLDEAVVAVDTAAADGKIDSLDVATDDLVWVATAPAAEGYPPPTVAADDAVTLPDSPVLCRWATLARLQAQFGGVPPVRQFLRAIVTASPAVPPALSR